MKKIFLKRTVIFYGIYFLIINYIVINNFNDENKIKFSLINYMIYFGIYGPYKKISIKRYAERLTISNFLLVVFLILWKVILWKN